MQDGEEGATGYLNTVKNLSVRKKKKRGISSLLASEGGLSLYGISYWKFMRSLKTVVRF